MGDKKGQVTIFIILAIIIVVGAVLAYIFLPKFRLTAGLDVENPNAFIESCMEEEIDLAIDRISSQGGSLNPEHYFSYLNTPIEYLCYTNQYYVTCVVQQPLLVNHLKSELDSALQATTTFCFNELKNSYEKKGYTIQLKPGKLDTEFQAKNILFNFPNYELTVQKGDTQKYDSFSVLVNNNLYELANIAISIIDWESRYGDAETTTYMTYYSNLKVEKKKQSDGTTIYILTNRDTNAKFQFASRSIAWPPGYPQ